GWLCAREICVGEGLRDRDGGRRAAVRLRRPETAEHCGHGQRAESCVTARAAQDRAGAKRRARFSPPGLCRGRRDGLVRARGRCLAGRAGIWLIILTCYPAADLAAQT